MKRTNMTYNASLIYDQIMAESKKAHALTRWEFANAYSRSQAAKKKEMNLLMEEEHENRREDPRENESGEHEAVSDGRATGDRSVRGVEDACGDQGGPVQDSGESGRDI